MYDIAIIGAGPAGMTAAIYARRGGKSTVMIDKLSFGGQIINTPEVENYPGYKNISGMGLANALYEQATGLGCEMKYTRIIRICKSDNDTFSLHGENGEVIEAKAVIIATGAKARPLGLPKEDRYAGAGISYCATCDGAFFRNKTVAVLGGGNVALEDAEVLSDLCSKVYLIHRRDKFRGDDTNVRRLQNKSNVEFMLNYVPQEIVGDNLVTGLKVRNLKTEEDVELELNGIFVAFGYMPENEDFADMVKLDESGYVDAAEDCITSMRGIFTAGDCRRKKVKQIVTATGDGAVAALAAIDYINSL